MVNLAWIEENIKGALYPNEGTLLFKLARRCEGQGVIVEIGSLLGKSTAFLALGSKAHSNAKVFAIDTFDGGDSKPRSKFVKDIIKKGEFFEEFKKNMEKAGMNDIVVPINMESAKAIYEIDEPIEFLFINGAHTYELVKQDFLTYFPQVIDRGTIALHDREREGVKKFIDEDIKTKHDIIYHTYNLKDGKLLSEGHYKSIQIFRRVDYGRVS